MQHLGNILEFIVEHLGLLLHLILQEDDSIVLSTRARRIKDAAVLDKVSLCYAAYTMYIPDISMSFRRYIAYP